MVESEKQTTWLTMKQVIAKTRMKATTVSRYKDEFPEYVTFRSNGQLLEFAEGSVLRLIYIYELYQDRSEGRRTTERVRDILQREYGVGESPIIDITAITTTPPPQDQQQLMVMIANHLREQDRRMAVIESNTNELLEQNTELLASQLEIKQMVNDRLALISEIAATRREEKNQGFWLRFFRRA